MGQIEQLILYAQEEKEGIDVYSSLRYDNMVDYEIYREGRDWCLFKWDGIWDGRCDKMVDYEMIVDYEMMCRW